MKGVFKYSILLSLFAKAQAVFKPGDLNTLKAATDSCISVDSTGVTCCFNDNGFSAKRDTCASDEHRIGDIDTSDVTDFRSLFHGKTSFNADISGWDTSSVTTLSTTFKASAFDGDISNWDTSKVTHMDEAFKDTSFNQDISGWDTSSVITMFAMFENNNAFTGPIRYWNVSSVGNFEHMFKNADSFTEDLNCWDVSGAEYSYSFSEMFADAAYPHELCWAAYTGSVVINDVFDGATGDGSINAGCTPDKSDCVLITNINQCSAGTHTCGAWQDCTDLVDILGGAEFECSCKDGFNDNGGGCECPAGSWYHHGQGTCTPCSRNFVQPDSTGVISANTTSTVCTFISCLPGGQKGDWDTTRPVPPNATGGDNCEACEDHEIAETTECGQSRICSSCEAKPCTAKSDVNDTSPATILCANGNVTGSGLACACTCHDGWQGAACDEAIPCTLETNITLADTVTTHKCLNGGTVKGTYGACGCDCSGPYQGVNCEVPIPCQAKNDVNDTRLATISCAATGTVGGSGLACACTCNAGFQGAACDEAIPCTLETNTSAADTTTTHKCDAARGTLSGTYGACLCTCKNGFTGVNCDTCAAGFGFNGTHCAACDKPQANDKASHDAVCVDQVCGLNRGVVVDGFAFDRDPLVDNTNCYDCPDGMQSSNTSGVCTSIVCGQDKRVQDNACVACPIGTENVAGGHLAGFNDTLCTELPCDADERVDNHTCVACELGYDNEEGDLRSGSDTQCDKTDCEADFYVLNKVCTACPPGTTNEAGDLAPDGNTTCDPTICAVDEFVSGNNCTKCAEGYVNLAGDDASQADTTCELACLKGFRVQNKSCVACVNGTDNDPGDNPEGADTNCFDAALCGNKDIGRVYCVEENTEKCEDDLCVCKEGFTGVKCDLVTFTVGGTGKSDLVDSLDIDLPGATDEELEKVQENILAVLTDITTAEARKDGADIRALVLENTVELQKKDLTTRQKIILQDKKPVLAAAPDILTADTCDTDPSTCASADLEDVADDAILFLETAPREGAYSIMANKGSLISKQTRTSSGYEMECRQDSEWKAKTRVQKGDLYECNGNVLLIGSQAPICKATRTIFKANGDVESITLGTCGAHGTCTSDGTSFKCACDTGYAGEFCDELFEMPKHCHSLDCSDYGGHKDGAGLTTGVDQASLISHCCKYSSRALFDAACATTDKQQSADLGCCHRTYCV